jgi:hypothetical protein
MPIILTVQLKRVNQDEKIGDGSSILKKRKTRGIHKLTFGVKVYFKGPLFVFFGFFHSFF